MLLRERFKRNQPIEQMEVALVRAVLEDPKLLDPPEEAALRTALSVARLYKIRFEGRDIGIGSRVAPFREWLVQRLSPVLLKKRRRPARAALAEQVGQIRSEALRVRDQLVDRVKDRVPAERVHREICRKSLVLATGGGGGTGYVYLGVLAALDDAGLHPALMAGTSIGAILCMFRSRLHRYDHAETLSIVRGLSWSKLFRAVSTENRYGLPAALRLFLRAGLGRYFDAGPQGEGGLKLSDLPVKTLVAVSGIRRGMLPRPVESYERLLNIPSTRFIDPGTLARKIQETLGTLAEFFVHPEIMVQLHLGLDEGTQDFDALDAVGFSSALPGVIHYDVLRDDQRMHRLLDGLFESRGLFRLVDGGLTDNLPAKAAWKAVQKGLIGTRNAFILGLNGFAPKLSTPLWLPLQQLAELAVAPNRPYAHLVKDFRRTLSPLELVPTVEAVTQALALGRKQIEADLPLLRRMLEPLPVL